jgi:hypothetical protein
LLSQVTLASYGKVLSGGLLLEVALLLYLLVIVLYLEEPVGGATSFDNLMKIHFLYENEEPLRDECLLLLAK